MVSYERKIIVVDIRKDAKKSLKSECLTRTYKKTSHTG